MGNRRRDGPGGIVGLAGLVRDHARHIEGDLALKGIDLRDLFRRGGGPSRLTWRRLSVILDALPGESNYKTAVRDALAPDELASLVAEPRKGHGRWSHSDLLIADVIDGLRNLLYVTVKSRGGDMQQPQPYPRPGVGLPRRANPIAVAAIRAIAEEHARLHGYDLNGGVTGG